MDWSSGFQHNSHSVSPEEQEFLDMAKQEFAASGVTLSEVLAAQKAKRAEEAKAAELNDTE